MPCRRLVGIMQYRFFFLFFIHDLVLFSSTLNIRSCFDVLFLLLNLLFSHFAYCICCINQHPLRLLLSILLRPLVPFFFVFCFLHAFPAPVTSTSSEHIAPQACFHETIHLFLINNHRSLIGGNSRQVAREILFPIFAPCKRGARMNESNYFPNFD